MRGQVPPDLLGRFLSVLARRLGWGFEEARLGHVLEVLNSRLLLLGVDAIDYVDRLENAPNPDELRALARHLTVPETYFFRNQQQFAALRAILSSEYGRANEARPRILSAGCASGEEPYSLAMLLREVLPDREPSILAIDINPAMLERAKNGRFSAWSLRETEPMCIERWFRQKGPEFVLDEQIKSSVKFAEGNLMLDDPELLRPESYDVIFCRNVIMYFTPENCRKVVERLSRALTNGGHLFLGSAETLRGVSHDFHLCHSHEAFYYRRQGSRARPTFPALAVSGRVALEAAEPASSNWVDDIGRAAARVGALAAQPATPRSRAAAPLTIGPAPTAARSDLSVPLDLLHRERFAEALGYMRARPADVAHDADALLLEAVLLVSGGLLAEAKQVCDRLLAQDELSAGAHYVLALCDAGAGELPAAAYHDRVATYLDPEFAMPRLHLGLLLRRGGDQPAARQELMHARALLEREDTARLLMFGGGFGREALLALCLAELAAAGVGS